jgi:hypothetical protein
MDRAKQKTEKHIHHSRNTCTINTDCRNLGFGMMQCASMTVISLTKLKSETAKRNINAEYVGAQEFINFVDCTLMYSFGILGTCIGHPTIHDWTGTAYKSVLTSKST